MLSNPSKTILLPACPGIIVTLNSGGTADEPLWDSKELESLCDTNIKWPKPAKMVIQIPISLIGPSDVIKKVTRSPASIAKIENTSVALAGTNIFFAENVRLYMADFALRQ